MGRHAAPTRTSRARAHGSRLAVAVPLALLAVTASASAATSAPTPLEAAPVVTPAADGSVPNIPAPDGYYPGD